MSAGLYFVDAQGDVTWNKQNSGAALPALSIARTADLRFRNYRFPNVAWVPTRRQGGPGTDVAAKAPVVEIVNRATWSEALEDLSGGGGEKSK
jgi:hypothetical protein